MLWNGKNTFLRALGTVNMDISEADVGNNLELIHVTYVRRLQVPYPANTCPDLRNRTRFRVYKSCVDKGTHRFLFRG